MKERENANVIEANSTQAQIVADYVEGGVSADRSHLLLVQHQSFSDLHVASLSSIPGLLKGQIQ